THADGDNTQGIHVWGVGVCSHAGIGESNAVAVVHHRRHFFEVNLVHDAVTRTDHVDVFKGGARPVDKVEAVFVTALFHFTVFFYGIFIIATVLHRKGVVHNQLCGHYGVYLPRITALLGNRLAQTRKIHQGRTT